MHELSIATGILDRALSAAEAHGADRIEALRIELGEATHVNQRQLRFCLETSLEGTIAAGARVRIDEITPQAACDCGWNGRPQTLEIALSYAPDVRCPECDSRATLVRGRECRLASIDVPDEAYRSTETPETTPTERQT